MDSHTGDHAMKRSLSARSMYCEIDSDFFPLPPVFSIARSSENLSGYGRMTCGFGRVTVRLMIHLLNHVLRVVQRRQKDWTRKRYVKIRHLSHQGSVRRVRALRIWSCHLPTPSK